MTHDRDYWRSHSATRLIEAARESRDELTIALGERLEDFDGMEERLAEAEAELRLALNDIEALETRIAILEQAEDDDL